MDGFDGGCYVPNAQVQDESIQRVSEVVDDAVRQILQHLKCPKCEHEFTVLRHALWEDNKLTMRLTLTDGHMLQARTIGESIINMGKLLKAAAKDLGVAIDVLVPGIRFSDKGIDIDFVSALKIEKRQ